MEESKKEWNQLDNNANLFPSICSKTYSTYFRIEVFFREALIAECLLEALEKTLQRYPIFQVRLRKGLFWYYFENYNYPTHIRYLDNEGVCTYSKITGKYQKPLWRVFAKGSTLAIEISHVITDGSGAVEFLKTMLCVYYEKVYGKIKDWGTAKKPDSKIDEKELEYSYRRHFKNSVQTKLNFGKAFHYPDERHATYHKNHLELSLSQFKQKAKIYNLSITEFLTSIHLDTVQSIYKQELKKKNGLVRDLVLINLRNFFDSCTTRNFYLFVMPSINFALGEYSFEEIAKKVRGQTHDMTDKNELQSIFSRYVSAEKEIIHRAVPLPIKDFLLPIIQKVTGERIITSSISNLGNMDLPQEFSRLISSFSLIPLPSVSSGKNIGVMGYNDTMSISFGGYISNIKLEQAMARKIQSFGVDVTFYDR